MVVYVIPSWYPPRGGEFFQEHCMALAAEGLDVHVLACIETSIRKHGLPAYIWQKGIHKTELNEHVSPGSCTETRAVYRTIPGLYHANVLGWIRRAVAMADKYIRLHGKPDLIQAHSSIWAGVVAARIKQKYDIPYVITEHRSRFVCNTPEAEAMFLPWHEPLIKEAFEGASQVITVSDSLQKKICTIAPHHRQTISTIANMVDTRFFIPALKRKPAKPFVFFALAHLEPVKGFDTLIEAMNILSWETDDARLVIGGEGSQRKYLEALTVRHGLQAFVRFEGSLSREQVKAQLQAAHAFVLASRFEAFGVVYIEAMACGLPVIAARSGGPESFITESLGTLVEPDQPRELAEAMKSMIKNYHSYNQSHIWNNTLHHFSPKAIASRYLEIYNQLLA